MKTMCSKVYRLKFTSNLKTNGHLLSKTPGADQFLIPQTFMIFTKVYNSNDLILKMESSALVENMN